MRDSPSTPRRQVTLKVAAVVAMMVTVASASVSARPDLEKPGNFLADVALTPPAPIAAALTPLSLTAPATTTSASSGSRPNIAERVRDGASNMVLTAMNFLGVPYKRGGSSEEAGFDCSGFTRHIFELSMGLVLPRKADQQAHAPGLVPVKRDELRPGDLVFFNTLKRTFSHVGIYIGEGKFIHSPRAGGEIRIEEMSLAYWKKRFTGARRAEAPAASDPTASASAVAP
jgi:cell wall-associated NlpC family hydrolase